MRGWIKIPILLCLILIVVWMLSIQNTHAEKKEEEAVITGCGTKITKEDAKILEQYAKGIFMEKSQVEARKKRVEAFALEKYVDEYYFLYPEHYCSYSIQQLEEKGYMILVKCMTEEEIDCWVSRTISGIKLFYITKESNVITWVNEEGIPSSTYAFDVDGHVAFCGDHGKTAPPTGTSHSEYIEVTDARIIQLLHYGYKGPQDEMTRLGYSRAKSYVIMAMAISHFRHGEPLGKDEMIFWNHIKNLPKPTKGKAYYVKTRREEMQDLFFYDHPKEAKLEISKISSRFEITDGNKCYTLEGATFGIYRDALAKDLVCKVTTKKDGKVDPFVLPEGTYYIKEEKSPEGFALQSHIYETTVVNGQTTTEVIENTPQMNMISMLLQKKDRKEGEGTSPSLEGAQFQMAYYAGLFPSGEDPKSLNEKAKRTWTFRTDKNGIVKYEKSYLVSGDELYRDLQGKEALPLGTYRIVETKAPEGYVLNPKVFLIEVTSSGNKEHVTTYVTPTVWEDRQVEFSLCIHKENEKKMKLKDAVFTLYEDAQKEKKIASGKTNLEGIVTFGQLAIGKTYYLQEEKAPEGYRLPLDAFGKPIAYEIRLETSKTGNVRLFVNGKEETNMELQNEKEAHMRIQNEIAKTFPNTGSIWSIPLWAIVICMGMVFVNRMKKESNNKGA